jgi:hypothetical protein
MRDAKELKNTIVEVDGARGKITGFWLTENNVVYAKIKNYKGQTVNHPLTTLHEGIKVVDFADDDETPLFI